MTTLAELPSGFADKVSSAQSTFRSVMDAMARPGSVQRIASDAGTPSPMLRGTAAMALTLFDHDTPLWLDPGMSATPEVSRWLKFHTSAPLASDASLSAFALIGDAAALPTLDCFLSVRQNIRTVRPRSLSRSTADAGPAFELRGPGIDGVATLQATIQPSDLFERLSVNAALFPRGIDVVLVADDCIVAIPRTTRVVAKGG